MKNKESRLSKMIQSNFYLKILALLIGLFFWLFVSLSKDIKKREITGIKLDLEKELDSLSEIGLVATQYNNTYITVEVEGETLEVNTLEAEDFEANLDLSVINSTTTSDTYQVRINVTPFSASKAYEYKFSPKYIDVTVDRYIQRVFTIEADVETIAVEQGYIQLEPILTPKEILISGPEQELDAISKVKLEVKGFPEEEVSETFKNTGELKLIDGNDAVIESSSLKISEKTALLTVPIHKEKDIPVHIIVTGAPKMFTENAFAMSQNTIKVTGPKSAVDKLEDFTFSLPIYQIKPNLPFVFNISEKIQARSEITNTNNISEITAQLDIPNISTITVDTENILVSNKPANFDVEILSEILTNIQLIGNEEDLAKIKKEDIIAEVDFYNKASSLSAGKMMVNVNIEIANKDLLVWAFDVYSVSVELTEK